MRSSTTRLVVAANIRARLAWAGLGPGEVQALMGWTRRTTYNKLHGISPLTAEELEAIADLVEADPGDLYRVPEGFSSPSASSNLAEAA